MISIIIPVYNEAPQIPSLLDALKFLEGDFEIIFSDGLSLDETRKSCENHAKTIVSRKGRANQMNEGAKQSIGNILLFLHADCRLHPKTIKKIEKAVDSGYVGGCFTLYSGKEMRYRFIDLLGKINSFVFKEYFGDHGIFVRSDIFEIMGGFRDMEIMEDVDFSKRLKKMGKTIQLKHRIYASPKRFEKGFVKTLTLMLGLRLMYSLRVSPKKLSKYYFDIR